MTTTMEGAARSEASPAPAHHLAGGLRAIQRLPDDVVNKIAAGEIIQRPANALKEMMENSLDAGAKMIRIQLREGGSKMLQIQDDGSGVSLQDMPLLCERFATSKLRAFEDLSAMTTFGFRGEALASISYVSAGMTVVSRTRECDVAYKASYANGVLAPPKPGQSSEPRPCAGAQGTMITAEDLFYNVPQRRKALKSANDEYALALDVVSKYAVHYGGRGVGFSCKKASANVVDLSVPSSATLSTRDAISIVYGNIISKNLQRVEAYRDEALNYNVEGYVSGPNYHTKRASFLLFINDRLVDCPALRRAVLSLYMTLLPKGSHPWIYLKLDIDPASVDVNVHPTKKEVHFLHEDEIIDGVCVQVEAALAGASNSRSFQTSQAILPSSMRPSSSSSKSDTEKKRAREEQDGDSQAETLDTPSISSHASKRLPASRSAGYPQHLVRVDGKMRTLDAMGYTSSPGSSLKTQASTQEPAADVVLLEEEITTGLDAEAIQPAGAPETPSTSRSAPVISIRESQTELLSINTLREKVTQQAHYELKEVFRDHAFVGIADADRALSLLQHRTKLYLVQYALVLKELSYQLLLRQFGALQPLSLSPAPYICDLVVVALEVEGDISKEKRRALALEDNATLAQRVQSKLVTHADMLHEYFAIGIQEDADGRAQLTSLPNIIGGAPATNIDESSATTQGHADAEPQPQRLLPTNGNIHSLLQLERVPALMIRLATQVDYTNEEICFKGILTELALAHVPLRGPCSASKAAQGVSIESVASTSSIDASTIHDHDWRRAWSATMRHYIPSKQLEKSGAVKAIASLPSLYSVFERC